MADFYVNTMVPFIEKNQGAELLEEQQLPDLPDASAGDDVIQRLKEDMVELTNDASLEEIMMNLHILHFTLLNSRYMFVESLHL